MTDGPPTVSVVIPTYDCSRPLKAAVESVLRQDFGDLEVWVVGDGCTDDSEAVVTALGDERVRWINLPENSGGPAIPRDEALRRARGSYIAYLGHDDLWFPWHLSGLVEAIEASGGDFVCSVGVLLRPEGVAGSFTLPDRAWNSVQPVSPSNWLHRRDLTETVGPWTSNVRGGHDRDFLRRVQAAGVQPGLVGELSVLRFPAVAWGVYSLDSDYPQVAYAEAMRRDPHGLRDRLLAELEAVEPTGDRSGAAGARGRLPVFMRRLVNGAMNAYGYDRWPVDRIVHRRWRKRAGLTGPG